MIYRTSYDLYQGDEVVSSYVDDIYQTGLIPIVTHSYLRSSGTGGGGVSQALGILGTSGNTTTASYAGMSQWASNVAASVPGGGGFQNYAISSGVNLALIYNPGQTASASGGFINNLYDSVDWLGRQAQALDQRYAVSERAAGLGMMAVGGLEIGGGVAIATGGTAGTGGLAAPAAIGGDYLIAAHGADVLTTGWHQLWSGQTVSTHTTQLLQSSGMSPAWAQTSDAVISIVGMNASNAIKLMPTRVPGTTQVGQAPVTGAAGQRLVSSGSQRLIAQSDDDVLLGVVDDAGNVQLFRAGGPGSGLPMGHSDLVRQGLVPKGAQGFSVHVSNGRVTTFVRNSALNKTPDFNLPQPLVDKIVTELPMVPKPVITGN